MIPKDQSFLNGLTIKELRQKSAFAIADALLISFDESLIETDILLLLSLNYEVIESKQISRSGIYSILNDQLEEVKLNQYKSFLAKRLAGLPVAYLTKQKDFYSYSFYVDQRVLIPRPETELLVDKVVELVKLNPDKKINIYDIGVGSGAIICSSVLELIRLGFIENIQSAIGVDLSAAALEVAKLNIKRFNLENSIELIQGSLLGPIKLNDNLSGLNIIVSNPPYLDFADENVCKRVKTFEPHIALFSEQAGMSHYEKLISDFSVTCSDSPQLVGNSHLVLEIGYNQADKVECLVQKAKNLALTIEKDLGNMPRLVHIIPC